MRRILYCLLIISTAQVGYGTDKILPTPIRGCPVVTVDCPTQFMGDDVPARFSADVIGGDPAAKITYHWTVSAGTIIGGQGTFAIIVDQSRLSGQSLTATVEIGGFDSSCQTIASCSIVWCLAPLSRKFDEYGPIAFKDEKARLDNFAIQLENEPGSQAYIIAYDKRNDKAQARADRARTYLVSKRGIDSDRIKVVDGGARINSEVELWIAPTGANPPKPTPTASPDKMQTSKDTVKRN